MKSRGWRESAKYCVMQMEILRLLVTIGHGRTVLSVKFKFCDGSTSKRTAKIITENMYSQVDLEWRKFQLLKKYVTTGRIGVQYQRYLDSLYLRMATIPQKGWLWDGRYRLNEKKNPCNVCISRIWRHCTPWISLSTRSRIRSTRSLWRGQGGGSLGALIIVADWWVRVFGMSCLADRPSSHMYVHTITLSRCMYRPYNYINLTSQVWLSIW